MSADSHAVSPPGTDILVRPHPAGLQLDRVRSMSQSGGVGSPAPKDGAGLPNPEGGGADAARISTDCELDARVSLNHAGALVGTGVACGEARHPPSSQAPTDRTTGPVAASRVGLPRPDPRATNRCGRSAATWPACSDPAGAPDVARGAALSFLAWHANGLPIRDASGSPSRISTRGLGRARRCDVSLELRGATRA